MCNSVYITGFKSSVCVNGQIVILVLNFDYSFRALVYPQCLINTQFILSIQFVQMRECPSVVVATYHQQLLLCVYPLCLVLTKLVDVRARM